MVMVDCLISKNVFDIVFGFMEWDGFNLDIVVDWYVFWLLCVCLVWVGIIGCSG